MRDGESGSSQQWPWQQAQMQTEEEGKREGEANGDTTSHIHLSPFSLTGTRMYTHTLTTQTAHPTQSNPTTSPLHTRDPLCKTHPPTARKDTLLSQPPTQTPPPRSMMSFLSVTSSQSSTLFFSFPSSFVSLLSPQPDAGKCMVGLFFSPPSRGPNAPTRLIHEGGGKNETHPRLSCSSFPISCRHEPAISTISPLPLQPCPPPSAPSPSPPSSSSSSSSIRTHSCTKTP